MRDYFFNDLGKQHVFVLYGLGGAGKSQIAFKFVNECQVENQDPRYTTYFPEICIFALDSYLTCQGSPTSYSSTPARMRLSARP